jgi:hypothetical protein
MVSATSCRTYRLRPAWITASRPSVAIFLTNLIGSWKQNSDFHQAQQSPPRAAPAWLGEFR